GVNIANTVGMYFNTNFNVNSGTATQLGVIGDFGLSEGITKTGNGTLILKVGFYLGGTTINGGILSLANSLTVTSGITVADGATLQLQSGAEINSATLALASGSTLDITTNSITFDTTVTGHDAATLLADLTNSYDEGAWDLPGITSSVAAASSGITTIGYLNDSDTNTFTIAYTLPGDTNLDGVVDAEDATNMTHGIGWNDFNYDGVVNADDLALFLLGVAYGTPPAVSVPEPAMPLAMLGIVALAASRRRRGLGLEG
ncbi:MAG TPA: hypothetical protein VG722_04725, partial [Tepidisphaeraceae bacterium]|nr:hypothetical protein [Tepidisphaeraceae bacterium]